MHIKLRAPLCQQLPFCRATVPPQVTHPWGSSLCSVLRVPWQTTANGCTLEDRGRKWSEASCNVLDIIKCRGPSILSWFELSQLPVHWGHTVSLSLALRGTSASSWPWLPWRSAVLCQPFHSSEINFQWSTFSCNTNSKTSVSYSNCSTKVPLEQNRVSSCVHVWLQLHYNENNNRAKSLHTLQIQKVEVVE